MKMVRLVNGMIVPTKDIRIDGDQFVEKLTKEERRILKRKKCEWVKCRKKAKFIVEGEEEKQYFCKKHHDKFQSKIFTQRFNRSFLT